MNNTEAFEVLVEEASYRLTKVTTEDFGDGPFAGFRVRGQLSRIPDRTPWGRVPQVIEIAVPPGTRPGIVFDLSIRARAQDGGK